MIYHYKKQASSTGFTDIGKAVGYRSANSAGLGLQNSDSNSSLLLSAPLSSVMSQVGPGVHPTGSVQFTEQSNIPCVYLSNNYYLKCYLNNIPTGNSSRTISIWFKPVGSNKQYMLGYGNTSSRQYFSLLIQNGQRLGFVSWDADYRLDNYIDLSIWHNYLATYQANTLNLYVDGTLQKSVNVQLNTQSSILGIGARHDSAQPFTGYLAQCLVYNRALTQSQITAIANSLHPSDR